MYSYSCGIVCVAEGQKKQQGNPCGKEKAMNITEITSVRQQTAERLRLAPYCRVSSDSTDQLHSFAAQIRYYSDYAKKHPEYQLVDIYADEGITGTEMKKRDELNRLIADCRKGKVDRTIVTEHRGAARAAADVQRDRRERVFRGTGHRHRKTEYGNDRNIPRYGRTARKCEHIGEFALELSKANAVR